MLICENDMSNIDTGTWTDKQIFNVTCHSDRNWIPNPAYFIECCSAVTTTPGPSGITILPTQCKLAFNSLQSSLVC
jgi:hypothetical protein